MALSDRSGGPLEGLRVIEVCTFVAGPLAGLLLAQQGAEVIRVDPLGGAADIARMPRSSDGTSIYWASLNKHKKSVTLDLRSEQGRALVCDLVAAPGRGGGILTTNAVGASWLARSRLQERRDDVIKVHIEGHAGGAPAVDYTVNAAVGFPSVTGPMGWAGPVNNVLPAWDLVTGSLAANGLLAAERRRLLDGHGDLVEIALADVALAMTGNLGYLAEVETLGAERPRTGNYIYGTFGKDFESADGQRVMIAAFTRRQWRGLLEATGMAEAINATGTALGLDLEDEADRYAAREAVAGILSPWFAARTLREIEDAFEGRPVLWSRYRDFGEVVDAYEKDPSAAELLDLIEQPGVGSHRAPRSPLRFTGAPVPPAAPAPSLGADTRETLGEMLGIGAAGWAELVEAGVVSDQAGTEPPEGSPT